MISVDSLLSRLENVQPTATGWKACCPAHDDQNPSLSINIGDGRNILLKCFAGCTFHDICSAIGLRPSELCYDTFHQASTSTQPLKSSEKRKLRRRDKQRPTFASPEAAKASLERIYGKSAASWDYHNADGDRIGMVVRWDNGDGKRIRPIARVDDDWVVGGMQGPRPLYRLLDVTDADRVYIVEGEKAADAAIALGVKATTSSQGSQSADKTDWTPLAGKECVLLPDNDDPGNKYARKVTALLKTLNPVPIIKHVDLPSLPPGGDIVDWIDSCQGQCNTEIKENLEAMADKSKEIEQDAGKSSTNKTLEYEPFPVYLLPEPIQSHIRVGAEAIGCDMAYIALPLLTGLASAIGNSRCLLVRDGWQVPAILWTGIVGESGTAKTPASNFALEAFHKHDKEAFEEYEKELDRYRIEREKYDKEFQLWKRSRDSESEPPVPPSEPKAIRHVISDVTVEALGPILRDNPHGILMERDELSGWFASFDRYAKGKSGGDAAQWLSMYNAKCISIDRKTGLPKTIKVPNPIVSITGGIQPGILKRSLSKEHLDSGMAARFLLCYPPRRSKKWSETSVPPKLKSQVATVVDRLYSQKAHIDENGAHTPVEMFLSKEAKDLYVRFYDRHGKEMKQLSGELASAWSKLEECPARLALVIHCTRWASNDPTLMDPLVVDFTSMASAVELTEWFKDETRRVYQMLSESEEEQEDKLLLDWLKKRDGRATVRETQQGNRCFRTAKDAELALRRLVERGLGRFIPKPPGEQGGRPTETFSLN